jgi:hypothetical protein
MRVGILTFHSSYNFGANLQTLAVQELFRSKGCQPVVIDYRDPWKTEMLRARVSPAQAEKHEQFVEKYLHTSPRFHSTKEVQEYCREALDVISVGSDQVFRLGSPWTPRSLVRALRTGTSSSWHKPGNDVPVYFLPWPKDGPAEPVRVTVAACAAGTSYFLLGTTLRAAVRRSLRAFDFVSVRDDWTGFMVRWLCGGDRTVAHCPDPVFGLNGLFRVPEEESPHIDVSKTILVAAAFDKDWLARFRDSAHDHGFTVSNLPDPDRRFAFDESDFTIDLPLSPLVWYSLLAGSAGYVGSRFHGLVSCAANGTPAVSLDWSNKPRLLKIACRKYDLCRKAGVPKRYVSVNWLRHPSPDLVLERLLDGASQMAVNRYAEQARGRLDHVLDTILSQVALQRGRQ